MKNLILGLAVAAIAFSASGFKNFSSGDFLVNDPEHGYIVVSFYDFTPDYCTYEPQDICAYRILTTDPIPFPLSETQMQTLIWFEKILLVKEPISGAPLFGTYIP